MAWNRPLETSSKCCTRKILNCVHYMALTVITSLPKSMRHTINNPRNIRQNKAKHQEGVREGGHNRGRGRPSTICLVFALLSMSLYEACLCSQVDSAPCCYLIFSTYQRTIKYISSLAAGTTCLSHVPTGKIGKISYLCDLKTHADQKFVEPKCVYSCCMFRLRANWVV